MNDIKMIRETEVGRVLQMVFEQKLPLIISYVSGDRWRIARALVTDIVDKTFNIKFSPQKRTEPVHVKKSATVGVTFKCGYGEGNDRFIFDTRIIDIEQPADSSCIGKIKLLVPEQIEVVQRRSYERERVPESMSVDVNIWRRDKVAAGEGGSADVSQAWQGKLVEISAANLLVAVDFSQGPDLQVGQFIGLRFTPLPDETRLGFNAYVRSLTPTADSESLCVGLEMVGLEASPEGRLVLQRLCNVVEQYSKINAKKSHKS